MGKLPSIQLYPGDWLRDDIAGCTLEAQGLWLRMMFLMHDAEHYGYLAKNGSPIPPESIARRCGCTPEQYETLLAELDIAGIPSRTSEGIIYSRRMVRDGKERAVTAERQRRFKSKKRDPEDNGSGGVTFASSNAPSNASVTLEKRQSNTASSHTPLGVCSSSSSSSNSHSPPTPARAGPQQAAPSVSVRSKFDLKVCRQYADFLHTSGQGIEKPGGYATAIFRSGEADELIADFLTNPPDMTKNGGTSNGTNGQHGVNNNRSQQVATTRGNHRAAAAGGYAPKFKLVIGEEPPGRSGT